MCLPKSFLPPCFHPLPLLRVRQLWYKTAQRELDLQVMWGLDPALPQNSLQDPGQVLSWALDFLSAKKKKKGSKYIRDSMSARVIK